MYCSLVYIGRVPTTVFLFSKPVRHAVAVNTAGFKGFHLGTACLAYLVRVRSLRPAQNLHFANTTTELGPGTLTAVPSEPAPPAATIEVGVETRVGACRRVPLM